LAEHSLEGGSMGPEEFARACKRERDVLFQMYQDRGGNTSVAEHLRSADLTETQRTHVLAALDAALTDTFYNLLLALDGSASLGGGMRQSYTVTAEDGAAVATGDGRLEAAAWAAFHESE
jgi:hypothetical protein